MKVNVKVTRWMEVELPCSASQEEVIEILKRDESVNSFFDDEDKLGILSYDEIENTEDDMTLAENDWQATIELRDDNGEVIWSNQPEYPDVIRIEWGVEDFEGRAIDKETMADEREEYDEPILIYDRSKFAFALSIMEHKHDCNYGITWDTVDYFLDEYCKL